MKGVDLGSSSSSADRRPTCRFIKDTKIQRYIRVVKRHRVKRRRRISITFQYIL